MTTDQSSPSALSHHGVILESRYGLQHEIAMMAQIVDQLPEFIRDRIATVYCDSNATNFYTVGFKPGQFSKAAATIFERATVALNGGYNSIYFAEVGPSGKIWGRDYSDTIIYFEPFWEGDIKGTLRADHPNDDEDDLVQPLVVVKLDALEKKRRRPCSCGHATVLLSKPRLNADGSQLHAGGLRCQLCLKHLCWLRADEVADLLKPHPIHEDVLCKVLRHTGKPPGWYIYARGPDASASDGYYSDRHGDFDNVADAIAAAKKLARTRGWLFVGLEPTIRDTLDMWGG